MTTAEPTRAGRSTAAASLPEQHPDRTPDRDRPTHQGPATDRPRTTDRTPDRAPTTDRAADQGTTTDRTTDQGTTTGRAAHQGTDTGRAAHQGTDTERSTVTRSPQDAGPDVAQDGTQEAAPASAVSTDPATPATPTTLTTPAVPAPTPPTPGSPSRIVLPNQRSAPGRTPAPLPSPSPPPPRRRKRRYPVMVATGVAALLHVLWFFYFANSGGDLAAQDAWAEFVGRHPDSAYNLAWYGGMHPVSYSVVSPYVMSVLGVRSTMMIAGTLSAALTALILVRVPAVRNPMACSLAGVFAFLCNALSGRVTFGLGMMFALGAVAAVFCWPHRWRRRRWAKAAVA
ncbi:hypothetical protein ACFW57_16275, partial [Streptomyces sp. NPDC058757]